MAGDDPPDATIVDVDLPGNGGMRLANLLRDRAEDAGVILLSEVPSFAGGVVAMRMGVNDYLLKPCSRQDLLEAVGRALVWRLSVQRAQSDRALLREAVGLARNRAKGVIAGSSHSAGGALDALLAVMRCRLPDTLDHARRVSRMSVRIATELGVNGRNRTDIEQAGLLHDIGKVAIPDELLEATGPLSEEEAEFLRTHVSIGFEILSALPDLRRAAHIVVATHERFDGSGYPSSLVGNEIPLAARIIAVADAYDTLAAGRPYRDLCSRDDVNAELVRCAGTHFDPNVVQAWLRIDEGALCS